jgi:Fe-S oxidoreductase
MFKEYSDLTVQTIYELLKAPSTATNPGEVTVHDPCGVRFDSEVHAAARRLVTAAGCTVREMKHHGTKTLCCGEGGAVGYLDREMAQAWTELRRQEAGDLPVITYCAGCSHFLGRRMTTHHLLDLLFAPTATLAGRSTVNRSPLTYWQRFRLKKKLAALLPLHQGRCRREMTP